MALMAVGVGILIGVLTLVGTPDADLDLIRLHLEAARDATEVLTEPNRP